jgi:IS605 OrfB family transposase
MKQTLFVRLDTTKEQFDALLQTMRQFNRACNFVAPIAFKLKTTNKMRLQRLVYRRLREEFGLSAQMAVRAIAKVCEAYKRDKSVMPKFRPNGAMVYDQRILSWKGLEYASILTLKGRIKVPIRIGEYQKARMDRIRGQADLILRNGVFYLAVVVDTPEPSKFDPVGVLGVDLGIVNLATDSDGVTYMGEGVDRVMRRYERLRAELQRRGTKSAKRHLKRLSGRERRFRRNVNHIVSKSLVAKAKGTGRAIALEDLRGIRDQTTVAKAQRRRHGSWGFRQLRSFIEYKAALAGVPVIIVNPRGTSLTCPVCGCMNKRNRPNRESFRCVRCGFAGPADHIAALNIATRAAVNQPIVPEVFSGHFVPPLGTSPHPLGVGS